MIQYSLRQEFSIKGRGIHSGIACEVLVKPGLSNKGYTLVRQDLRDQTSMTLHPDLVSETDRCTTLSNGSASVHTAEHLLSALFGLGILDAEIYC